MDKPSNVKEKPYELLYIISNKYSENELDPILGKVQSIITDKQGSMVSSNVWGKKKLAYPIKGFVYGYYVLLEFDVASENVKEIDNLLRMEPDLIRYQLVKRILPADPEHIKKVRKPMQEKPAPAKEEPVREMTEESKAKEAKKVDLKDLDEKLDKILDVDSLL